MKQKNFLPFFCEKPPEKGDYFLQEIKEDPDCRKIVEASFYCTALSFLVSFILSSLFVSAFLSTAPEKSDTVFPDFSAGLIFFLPVIFIAIFTRLIMAKELSLPLRRRLFPLFPEKDFFPEKGLAEFLAEAFFYGIFLQIPVFLIGVIQKKILQIFSISLPVQERVLMIKDLLEKGDIFPILLFAVPVLFLAPLAEELFFRMILFERLALTWKKEYAVWGTTILFAMLHGNPGVFLPLLVVGYMCQKIYLRSHSILTAVCLHFSFNISTMILLFLTKS
ncbi:MAG: CPBP family intramembrane metalloprotease [Lentisphaeria bacterium]|nr:CPBP family intramembrane metalloprotease [Lentisphaeria bacterium]